MFLLIHPCKQDTDLLDKHGGTFKYYAFEQVKCLCSGLEHEMKMDLWAGKKMNESIKFTFVKIWIYSVLTHTCLS